ncbi:post-segregation antitoxin CcdA family protein [Vibrio cholerae]|uniref:type II toxin-antitoxin system CcdA family antitoxin n=1 Tax=Vibrio cholerae TaxID=666 RepID=UPI0011D64E96|nr:type II toxin-antitoxin system CcdA family antitoxin [Vibrio cholerae]TXX93914.1 plasmid maintenance protein CcdB [Vibrio cholerae]GHW46036.1 post-segregation antitoxin CcdA family protein [Vibrio cholerae]
MRTTFSTQAPKKATNLSLNSELLAEAKRLNINLSATMEKALEKEVSSRLKAEWLEALLRNSDRKPNRLN